MIKIQAIKEFFAKRDRFAAKTGIEILEVSEGRAKAKMEIREEHLNGVGTVQGGAIFTLADLAFAAAANSHGTVAVAINVNISYLKAISQGTLFAEAIEETVGSKIGTCSVRVTDQNGDLIAIFQGMVYRKKDRLEDIKP